MGTGTLSGTVLDLAGRSIPVGSGTQVSVCALEGSGYGEGTPQSDGGYAIDLDAPDSYNVWVYADGYSTGMSLGVSLEAGASVERDFRLAPAGAISGTVTDASTGGPISAADIYAEESSYPDLGWGYTTTDSGGAYRVGGLHATSDANPSGSSYDVYAFAPGYAQAVRTAAVAPGEPVSSTDFALEVG